MLCSFELVTALEGKLNQLFLFINSFEEGETFAAIVGASRCGSLALSDTFRVTTSLSSILLKNDNTFLANNEDLLSISRITWHDFYEVVATKSLRQPMGSACICMYSLKIDPCRQLIKFRQEYSANIVSSESLSLLNGCLLLVQLKSKKMKPTTFFHLTKIHSLFKAFTVFI